MQRCDLTGMSESYSETVYKVLLDRGGGLWVAGEQVKPRSEIRKLKSIAEKKFALHCPSDLFTLKFQSLCHRAKDFQRSQSLLALSERQFEQFDVFIRKLCRMTSGGRSTGKLGPV